MNPSRSLRIVLATVGSRGDVQPMLALAQALAGRGHVPVVAAPPNFEGWVRGLGFEFAPLGVDMQLFLAQNPEMMTGNPVTLIKQTVHYFRDQMPVQAEQLIPACDGAHVILSGGLAAAAPTVAQYLQIPILGVLFTTCFLPSGQHPPPNIPWHGLPAWMNHLFWRLNRVLLDMLMRGTLNRIRAPLGLALVDDVRRHLTQDYPLVIAVDQPLFPAEPRWNRRYDYTNFLFFDDPTPLDAELAAWVSDGLPPVFVGFGSMSGRGTDRMGKIIVEAVGATGRRCIVGAGWSGLGTGALPSTWRVVKDVPHALLFPRMAVVVHHGGSGTTAQALRAGVPQVVLPLILDQFHHAHRLHLAGITPRPVPMEKITAAGLTGAIQAAMALPAGPRQEVAARLRASDGRVQIVQRVEAMAGA